jgi:hypothetical protein
MVKQDMRIDVPTVGPDTLQLIGNLGGKGLVFEARKTYILSKAKFLEEAKHIEESDPETAIELYKNVFDMLKEVDLLYKSICACVRDGVCMIISVLLFLLIDFF